MHKKPFVKGVAPRLNNSRFTVEALFRENYEIWPTYENEQHGGVSGISENRCCTAAAVADAGTYITDMSCWSQNAIILDLQIAHITSLIAHWDSQVICKIVTL